MAELKIERRALGVTRKDKIKNEYVRGTTKIAKLGTNFGAQGCVGKIMRDAIPGKREEGQREDGWIW